MSSAEPPSRNQDASVRARLRVETPPTHYWRRWTSDAPQPEDTVTAAPQTGPIEAAVAPAEPSTGTGSAAQPSNVEEAPYRVLIVEDDRGQALFAQSVLHGAGMSAEVAMLADEVIPAIERFKPDLVLMDLHMPGQDGLSLTMHIRLNPQLLHLPIVFLTGDPDPERQFEVLESGADDFLTKPIRPRHLIAAVSNRIKRARQRVLAQPAPGFRTVNPETGLQTRAYLMQQLTELLESQQAGGLLFVEINGTPGLRERYGYASFEQLMAEAGRHMTGIVQPHALSRLTDNSFLVLATGVEGNDAIAALAHRLRTELGKQPFTVRDQDTIHLRGSIGYALLPDTFVDTGSALEATERAALVARQQADGVAAYVAPPAPEEEARLALSNSAMELAFQPIVAVAGGELAQYQVLLRMRQPDGTLVSAAQVIPVAEFAGRIVELDRMVMERVLDLLVQRQADGKPVRLFVSQSPRTLARDNMASWLLTSIAERGIEGTSLIIDLRLDDALIHSVTLRDFCNRLMPAGVQFCLSQYQPGAEAEALLTQLPLGYLRMSNRYSAAHNDQQLHDQLHEMIDLAHRLGLQVIGQQIEDPQAAAAMWMGGVDFIQGNLVQGVGSDLSFDFHNAVL